jgi:hypothetical protein
LISWAGLRLAARASPLADKSTRMPAAGDTSVSPKCYEGSDGFLEALDLDVMDDQLARIERLEAMIRGSWCGSSRPALHRSGYAHCAGVSARHRNRLARHRAPRTTNPPARSPGASR